MSRAQTAKLEEGPASKTSAADRGATSPAQRLTIRGYSDSGDVVTMGSGAGGLGALGSVAALGLSCVVLLCRVPAFIKDQGPSKVPSRCKVEAQCKVPAAGGTRARACTSVAHAEQAARQQHC